MLQFNTIFRNYIHFLDTSLILFINADNFFKYVGKDFRFSELFYLS